jgi:predicted RNA-binding protein (virulence factor B family)
LIQLGKYNHLVIRRFTDFGAYLSLPAHTQDPLQEEVLIPKRYLSPEAAIGQELRVFVYTDSEDRPVATTETPTAQVGELAYLPVVSTSRLGAFVDWNLSKDLFVPFSEQKRKFVKGEYYLVAIYLDTQSNRPVATTHLNKHLQPCTLDEGDEVSIQITDTTPLGWQVIIERQWLGLVYENEVFQPLRPGQHTTGFIKKLREDGKIDVALRPQGYGAIEGAAKQLYQAIVANGGVLYLTDKSAPEEIYQVLQMSKKVFKQAVGALYKQGAIRLKNDRIEL